MLTKKKKWKKILLFLLHIGITGNFETDPFGKKPGQFQKWPQKPWKAPSVPFLRRVAPHVSPLSFYTEDTQNSKAERTSEDLSNKRSYMIDPDQYDHTWTELFHKDKPFSHSYQIFTLSCCLGQKASINSKQEEKNPKCSCQDSNHCSEASHVSILVLNTEWTICS